MNIIEVAKKENIGKEYKVFLDGKDLGVWAIIDNETNGEFDFYQKYKVLSDRYVSQLMRMEFEEVTDWSKVPVDTKVLVSSDGKKWSRRHFAKYEDGKIYCFNSGTTSFTVNEGYCPCEKVSWEYAKLYQE
jgi:hypothetical protein